MSRKCMVSEQLSQNIEIYIRSLIVFLYCFVICILINSLSQLLAIVLLSLQQECNQLHRFKLEEMGWEMFDKGNKQTLIYFMLRKLLLIPIVRDVHVAAWIVIYPVRFQCMKMLHVRIRIMQTIKVLQAHFFSRSHFPPIFIYSFHKRETALIKIELVELLQCTILFLVGILISININCKGGINLVYDLHGKTNLQRNGGADWTIKFQRGDKWQWDQFLFIQEPHYTWFLWHSKTIPLCPRRPRVMATHLQASSNQR